MDDRENRIQENVLRVRDNIETAARKSGRHSRDITLIAVTKTVQVPDIRVLTNLGIDDLGENRAQELLAKKPELNPDLRWHFIGRLQTNKVKSILDKVCLIHSVDSPRLAMAIDRRAKEINTVAKILLEVNIGEEPSKGGVNPSDFAEFVEALLPLEYISINGIMCVPPVKKTGLAVDIGKDSHVYFEKAREVLIDIRKRYGKLMSMTELSMGMSNDYQEAIEEGATMIRVGTGLFGQRMS